MKLAHLLEDSWEEHRAAQLKVKVKAGIIPWVREEDGIRMLFVVSSDPRYGGTEPAIIKGSVDRGEKLEQAALRECEEEVGIPAGAFKGLYKLPERKVTGQHKSYKLVVFAGELDRRPKLKFNDKEIGRAEWLTLEEFQRIGRSTHEPFANDLVRWAQ